MKKYCLKPACNNKFGGGVTLKALSAAALVGGSIIGLPAMAQDSNVILNDSSKDVELTQNLFLTSIQATQSAILEGELALGTSANIKWSETPFAESEYTTTGSINFKVSDTDAKTYYYRYSKPAIYITVENQTIENKITNPTGTSSENPYIFKSGAGLNNPEGTKASIHHMLYQNNTSKGILESTTSSNKYAAIYGGAVYNKGELTEVIADFVNNSVSGETTGSKASLGNVYTYGGALANLGTIVNLTGDFINNTATGSLVASGGAIYNEGTIGNITGDFINNSVVTTGPYSSASGGAISNTQGSIGDITGYFINNSAEHSGGAIYNIEGSIGDITGYFTNNSAAFGGAIGNNFGGVIGDIKGYFIYNSSSAGGAIYNNCSIGNITGDFINNTAIDSSRSIGGAIYSWVTIGNITGDFINNTAIDSSGSIGGAIYSGSLGASGGAIYNDYGTIGNITGNFINNSARTSDTWGTGGAITNYGTIGDITGDFINNFVTSSSTSSSTEVSGGAIYSSDDTIGKKDSEGNLVGGIINSNFLGNYAKSDSGTAQGGAIWTNTDLNIIADNGKSEFTGNYVQVGDGEKDYQAIYLARPYSATRTYLNGSNSNDGTLYSLLSPNLNLIAKNNGTIIFNDKIAVDSDALAGYKWIELSKSETIGDTRKSVYTYNMLDKDNNVTGSYRYYSTSNYENIDETMKSVITYNMLDKDNNVTDSYRYYSTSNYETVGDNREYVYTFNILNDDNTIKETLRYYYYRSASIYTYYILDDENNVVKTIVTPISAFIIAKDVNPMTPISSEIQITGDSTGRVILNNNIESKDDDGKRAAVNVSLSNTTLHLGLRDNVLDGNNLTLNSGTLNMVNGTAGISALNNLTIAGDTNFVADVDLKNKEMDRFSAKEYGSHTGNLNVVGMNLLSDATEGEEVTAIYFAQTGLKNNVTNGTTELPQEKYQNFSVYTPIYKYNVKYDNQNEYDGKGDGGYFLFTKGDKYFRPGGDTGNTGNPSDAFNPSVLSTPVSSVAAAQATVNETFKYVFEHADAFTQLPSMERMAHINANQYALSTDYNQNLGSLATEFNNHAGWFRPYVTFESMNLKNGPKVNATTYGSLVGFDSNFQTLGKGWTGLTTGYIGYNGSQLSYSGVDTTMNGGILGVTQTFYKGNFWTALTASAGASVGQSKTMYGNEDFTSLMAGIGSKTGYNFEFKEGKYILQPIMFLSYTFVNTFDYTNAAGVRINADPAHSIQLNPSVRFIANTKNGWQPYASVGMVWNVMNENNVTANNVRLPEMSMKPYVEYGVGVQKRFKDRYTAFGQAMIRNGGRNGIALTAGFRWNLGKEGRPIEKVMTPSQQKLSQTSSLRGADATWQSITNKQISPKALNDTSLNAIPAPSGMGSKGEGVNISQTPTKLNLLSQTDILARANNTQTTTTDKKIVKQLTEPQKAILGAKPQNTTRTTYRATLKQL